LKKNPKDQRFLLVMYKEGSPSSVTSFSSNLQLSRQEFLFKEVRQPFKEGETVIERWFMDWWHQHITTVQLNRE